MMFICDAIIQHLTLEVGQIFPPISNSMLFVYLKQGHIELKSVIFYWVNTKFHRESLPVNFQLQASHIVLFEVFLQGFSQQLPSF